MRLYLAFFSFLRLLKSHNLISVVVTAKKGEKSLRNVLLLSAPLWFETTKTISRLIFLDWICGSRFATSRVEISAITRIAYQTASPPCSSGAEDESGKDQYRPRVREEGFVKATQLWSRVRPGDLCPIPCRPTGTTLFRWGSAGGRLDQNELLSSVPELSTPKLLQRNQR